MTVRSRCRLPSYSFLDRKHLIDRLRELVAGFFRKNAPQRLPRALIVSFVDNRGDLVVVLKPIQRLEQAQSLMLRVVLSLHASGHAKIQSNSAAPSSCRRNARKILPVTQLES